MDQGGAARRAAGERGLGGLWIDVGPGDPGDFFFPIYFNGRSPDVPGPARRTISASALRSHGCSFDQIKVVGLPDPKAQVDPKLELSRERARHVAEALKAAGLPDPVFQLSPYGEAGANLPSTLTPRRRVDVYVRFMR